MSYRVHGGCEGHAANDHQQVAEGQIEYVDVGHVPHLLVPDEYQYQRAVADGAHNEYQREQRRHDVRLGSDCIVVMVVGHRSKGQVHIRDVVFTDVLHRHPASFGLLLDRFFFLITNVQ